MNHEQRIADLHATYKNGRVEENIYFIAASSRFRVKMGRKWAGTFWTLEGARAKKAELLEERGAITRIERIEFLEKQLLRIKNELEELKREEPN